MSHEPLLKLTDVSKFYHGPAGAKINILDKINLNINSGEGKGNVTSVLAPYMAGKSTLLKIIAGIEKLSSGMVSLNGKDYSSPEGKAVYIPERPSSFPWLNVKENIEFGLSIKNPGIPGRSADELISIVGLTGYENHFPHKNSLGFRFRISLARAMALNPALILLDEPFRNIHGETKEEMYELIKFVSGEIGQNIVLATTNITEAIRLSSSIYLMKKNPAVIIKEIKGGSLPVSSKDEPEYLKIRAEIENSFGSYHLKNTVNFSI